MFETRRISLLLGQRDEEHADRRSRRFRGRTGLWRATRGRSQTFRARPRLPVPASSLTLPCPTAALAHGAEHSRPSGTTSARSKSSSGCRPQQFPARTGGGAVGKGTNGRREQREKESQSGPERASRGWPDPSWTLAQSWTQRQEPGSCVQTAGQSRGAGQPWRREARPDGNVLDLQRPRWQPPATCGSST